MRRQGSERHIWFKCCKSSYIFKEFLFAVRLMSSYLLVLLFAHFDVFNSHAWANFIKGLEIGRQLHKFSGIVPEAQSSPFEIYRQKKSSSNPKLDLLGRVTHKIQVRRGLDSSSMERIKNRTEEAERERNSRKCSHHLYGG